MNHKNIGINILRLILVVSIVCWMMVIFGFSSADGETSQSTSDIITEIIVENIYEDYSGMSMEKQQEIWDNISFVVRKTGHFGEYAILAILVTILLLTYKSFRKNKKLLAIAVIVCIVYAVTDELHQGFVEEEAQRLWMCIDSVGALCGTILVAVISCITNFENKKHTEF